MAGDNLNLGFADSETLGSTTAVGPDLYTTTTARSFDGQTEHAHLN
ncbi:hypothetical protein [Nonomuraea sp. NPDC003214]